MILKEQIDAICRAKRITYKELAEIVEVSPQSIYQLSSGKIKNPSSSLLGRFEKKLNINPSWFLNGEGKMLKDESVSEVNAISIDLLIKQLEQKDRIIEQKDNLIQTLQRIIDSQILSLGKWFDVSYSRFVFFVNLEHKFRYIIVMI